MKIKVSVLVPIYNHNIEYVKECLESLQAQTLQECEFILIDNEAIPEAKQLIKTFCQKDSRFKTIQIAHNEGYGKAMNAGLDIAQGEYIGIVESDDFVNPNMYATLYEIGHMNQVDIVKSLFSFKERNKPMKIGISFKPNEYNRVLKNLDIPDYCFKYGSYWSAIYKKQMLDKHKIRFEEQPFPSGEDIMWTLKTYFFCHNIWISHRCFYHYRIDNPNSSIRGKDKKIAACMNLYLKLNNYLEKKKYEMPDECWYIKSRREFLNFWWGYQSGCITKNKFQFFLRISKQLRYNLELGHVKLSPSEMEIYKRLAYHPVWAVIKDTILTIKTTNNKTTLAFLGIPIKVNKRLISKEITKYCFGLIKTTKTSSTIKKYALGIPVYGTTNKKGKRTKYLFGIPFSTTQENNNLVQISINNIEKRVARLELMEYDINSMLYAQSVHPNTFQRYLNCYKNKDVFLIGCGPSLKYFKGNHQGIYVGVNRSFLYEDISLDYLFIQDDLDENMSLANQYQQGKCKKFYGIVPHFRALECQKTPELQHIHRISLYDVQQASAAQYILHDYPYPYWPYDISKEPLRDWGGTIFSALQFILYTHPKRIYLVGCDCTDGGHFYGGKTEKFSAAIRWWVDFKNYIQNSFPNIEIISVNPIGLRNMFNNVYTYSFLEDHPETAKEKVQIL